MVLNWFIDYLLLSATAALLRTPTQRLRIVTAAAVGGVCSCRLLWSVPLFYSLLLTVSITLLLVKIAFRWNGLRAFCRQGFTFLCVSSLLSGLVVLLWRIGGGEATVMKNGVIYWPISPLALASFAVVSYGALRLYGYLTQKRIPKACEYTVTVNDGEATCRCRALLDTGLHLREPFSGSPVILVQRDMLLPCVSPSLREALKRAEGGVAVMASSRLRMIPYRTVNGSGLLPAFVPARVTLHRFGGKGKNVTGVYVALCDELVRGEYTALIGSDVIES